MNALILETNLLPSPIKEKFLTPKVFMQEREGGGVILTPLCDLSELKGIARGSAFTTEKVREYRNADKAIEDRGFNE